MIEQAVNVANKAHSGQYRKGTNIAYIIHPLEAGAIASSILTQLGKYDEEVISASFLHDVLEDTEMTENDLLENFSERTVFLVKEQSENKAHSWKQRKLHTINHLKEINDIDVKVVHLADKLSNMRSIHRDYKKLGDKLWERFNEKRKSEQGWYYKSLVESLVDLKGTNEYYEFEKLVDNIFS